MREYSFSITGLLTKRFTSIWRRSDVLYAIFGYKEKRDQKKHIRVMHEFASQIIEKRRDYLIQQQNSAATIDDNGPTSNNAGNDDDAKPSKKMVFLDVLLQATIDGKPLSNDEIIEETNTFMFAVRDSLLFFHFHFLQDGARYATLLVIHYLIYIEIRVRLVYLQRIKKNILGIGNLGS